MRQEINSIFVERTENGIDLYGAKQEKGEDILVLKGTKNSSDLAKIVYGENNEKLIERLKETAHQADNFITKLIGPFIISVNMKFVRFVD